MAKRRPAYKPLTADALRYEMVEWVNGVIDYVSWLSDERKRSLEASEAARLASELQAGQLRELIAGKADKVFAPEWGPHVDIAVLRKWLNELGEQMDREVRGLRELRNLDLDDFTNFVLSVHRDNDARDARAVNGRNLVGRLRWLFTGK